MKRIRKRRGFLYLAVLFTCLIVVATAGAAFSISTSRLRSEESQLDAARALRAAHSELHRIASTLSTTDLQWRTSSVTGEPSSVCVGIGGSRITSILCDGENDGDLTNDLSDRVVVKCYATVRNASRGVSCTLQPLARPLQLLEHSITCGGDIIVSAGASLATTGSIRSGGSVAIDTSAVASAAQWKATTAISANARGEAIVLGQPIAMPTESLINDYIEIGTMIPNSSLTIVNGTLTMKRKRVTATINDVTTLDEDSIYWIDALGLPLDICECRIEATLVVINSSRITITKANLWKPPAAGAAALITSSMIRIDGIERELVESTTSTNFNPPASSYRGIADTDTTDCYASCLEGLVYTPALFEWTANNPPNSMVWRGPIFCGTLVVGGPMSIEDDRRSQLDPPLGFLRYEEMQIVRGSWRRLDMPQ